jgi:hypothetical protein
MEFSKIWLAEKASFERLRDFSAGFNSPGKFNVLVFWAHPSIIATFPIHARVARGQFSGLPHEATSERTFSFSGRTCSDLRGSMAIEQVCAHVVGNAALRHRSASIEEMRQKYDSRSAATARKSAL